MKDKVFIIMPAYNAGKSIEKVFERIPIRIAERTEKYVVVNDGSTDDTESALSRLQNRYANLVVLRHDQNRGYGAAEKTLLNYAKRECAEAAVLLHSDGQYAPEKIPDLLKPFDEKRADIAQGSRMAGGGALRGGMPLYKYLSNKGLTAIENLAFGLKMAEYHSGFMVYGRRALMNVPFEKLSNSFEFDLEMIVMGKVKGLRIAEIPIPTHYGEEVSHLNPITYGFAVLGVVGNYIRGKYHSI